MDQGNLQPHEREPEPGGIETRPITDIAHEARIVKQRGKRIVSNDLLRKWDQMNANEDGPNYEEDYEGVKDTDDRPMNDEPSITASESGRMVRRVASSAYALGILGQIINTYGSDVFSIEEASPSDGYLMLRGVNSNRRFRLYLDSE